MAEDEFDIDALLKDSEIDAKDFGQRIEHKLEMGVQLWNYFFMIHLLSSGSRRRSCAAC